MNERILENIEKNDCGSVVANSQKIPTEELEKIVANFTLKYHRGFIGSKNRIKIKIFTQLRVWIYYHIGGYEIAEISELLECNPKTAYYNMSRFCHLVRSQQLFPFPEHPMPSYN